MTSGETTFNDEELNKTLIARLRELGDHASFVPHMHHTAADRIELLATTNEQLVATNEALVKERDEAINQLDSARHSVDVLEKRVAHFMSRAARIEQLTAERDEVWKRAAHAERMWGEAEVKLAECLERNALLEARLGKAVEALEWYDDPSSQGDVARATLAAVSETHKIKSHSDEFATQKGESHE